MPTYDFDVEEAKILQRGYLKIWEIFMHWFTWFFSADLLAMSWVVVGSKFHGKSLFALAAVWIACTVLGIVACIRMRIYTNKTFKRFESLAVEPSILAKRSISLMLAYIVTSWAWKATAGALAVTIPAWIILLLIFWDPIKSPA